MVTYQSNIYGTSDAKGLIGFIRPTCTYISVAYCRLSYFVPLYSQPPKRHLNTFEHTS